MNKLEILAGRYPLVSTLAAFVSVLLLSGVLQGFLRPLFDVREFADSLARLLVSALLLYLLGRAFFREVVTIPLKRPEGWPQSRVVIGMMCVLVVATYLRDEVDVSELQVDALRISRWLLRTFATGLWEELWFRGLCFGLLCRAWGHTRRGLVLAAIVQALLFGLLHLSNALGKEFSAVFVFQASYAFLVGIGFAGLVAFSRTLWPVVLLHGAINAAGNVDFFFAGRAFAELTTTVMAVMITLFLLCAALPGCWCLRHARLYAEVRSGTGLGILAYACTPRRYTCRARSLQSDEGSRPR